MHALDHEAYSLIKTWAAIEDILLIKPVSFFLGHRYNLLVIDNIVSDFNNYLLPLGTFGGTYKHSNHTVWPWGPNYPSVNCCAPPIEELKL